MDSATSLRTVAKVTYYLAWISVLFGGLVHFIPPVAAMFRAVDLSKRNLFEVGLLLFVVSAVSALRTLETRTN
jgi:hypothetical protein